MLYPPVLWRLRHTADITESYPFSHWATLRLWSAKPLRKENGESRERRCSGSATWCALQLWCALAGAWWSHWRSKMFLVIWFGCDDDSAGTPNRSYIYIYISNICRKLNGWNPVNTNLLNHCVPPIHTVSVYIVVHEIIYIQRYHSDIKQHSTTLQDFENSS